SGNFSPAIFQQTLQAVGMSEQGYIDSFRERNLRRQILANISKAADSPSVLITDLNNYNGETRQLRYVLVPQSAARTIPDPTDEALKRYYDNHHNKFTHPEYRKVGVLAVTPETVRNEVRINESDVRASYEASQNTLGATGKQQVPP